MQGRVTLELSQLIRLSFKPSFVPCHSGLITQGLLPYRPSSLGFCSLIYFLTVSQLNFLGGKKKKRVQGVFSIIINCGSLSLDCVSAKPLLRFLLILQVTAFMSDTSGPVTYVCSSRENNHICRSPFSLTVMKCCGLVDYFVISSALMVIGALGCGDEVCA